MKQAIMALDGGGSNLRIVVADAKTEEQLYFNEVDTGTNLSTVSNKEEALENVKNLIVDAYLHMPREYYLNGIGLSSAGTEIEQNKIQLEQTLKEVVEFLKISSDRMNDYPPKCYVTNDIDILLHSSDIALVAGTGTVAAVKYKDVKPYDNNPEIPKGYVIEKFDGSGQFLGDKGSGFWIGQEVLRRVGEIDIDNYRGYINSEGEFEEATHEEDLYLRKLVFRKLFKELNLPEEKLEIALEKGLKKAGLPEYVSLVYAATEANGKPFDRAKVGNMFSKMADDAAWMGDSVANDILKQSSIELYKNVKFAYDRGDFENKESCNLLLSGSVLVHSEIIRHFLENVIKERHPNVNIKINKEKPVWSTVKYVKEKLGEDINSRKDKYRKRRSGKIIRFFCY